MAAVGGMGLRPGLRCSVCAAGGLPGVGGRQVLWRHIQLRAGRRTCKLQQLCLFVLFASWLSPRRHFGIQLKVGMLFIQSGSPLSQQLRLLVG